MTQGFDRKTDYSTCLSTTFFVSQFGEIFQARARPIEQYGSLDDTVESACAGPRMGFYPQQTVKHTYTGGQKSLTVGSHPPR